ncbi:MAG TPA: amino acid permease [Methanothrix sp.]|nr:amino acid permease [Methanothrix sp.]HPT18713.1 amino acid permease [Methanothrix sp.]
MAFKMGLVVFTLVTLAALFNIRKYPNMAETQWQLISFCILAILLYLIPASLISAELSTGWPQVGGVYVWVKEAFGQQWGFVAIWLQWFQMTIGFVSAMTFIAATLAYPFIPSLADNKIFQFIISVSVWWGMTFLNFRGLKTYARISWIFLIIGMLIPAALLIFGGIWYIIEGNAVQSTLHPVLGDLIPDFNNIDSMVLLLTFVFLFIGIEMTATHANDIKNVKTNYPLAILIAGAVMAVVSVIGSIIVFLLVPADNLDLLAGIMQAFETIFAGSHWIASFIAILIVVGSIGEASTWILGPVRGLASTANDGNLPPVLQKTNTAGMPVNLMILQAIFFTFWAAVYTILPCDTNSSYWMLLALTSMVYIVMYFFMYAAAIKLRYSHPEVKRAFLIPGGKAGIWLVGGWGFLAMAFLLTLSMLPPSQISFAGIDKWQYVLFMMGGTMIIMAVPLIICRLRK